MTDRTVVIAPERGRRPRHLPADGFHPPANGDCPFCPGLEHETPPELFSIRDENGWQLRVVPNRYPAVLPDSPAYGFHEVVIECAEHRESPTQFNASQLANLFRAYHNRLLYHSRDPKIASVSLFKNVGRSSGASQSHAHSQLIALPFVPELFQITWNRPACVLCPMLGDSSRIVIESRNYTVLCPYAPRFAYEMWVLPRQHQSRFLDSAQDSELAELMQRALIALELTLPGVSWNWYLHTAARGAPETEHWHFQIIPRTTSVAGFEWSSGVFINDTPPEQAAATLRHKLPS